MAKNGSKSVAIFGNNQLNLVFKWWVNDDGQSIANNTTLVYWEMQLVSGSAGHLDSSAKKDYSVTVDGKTWTGTNTVGIANNATKKLASGSKTVTHNANGTKDFSYSFSQAINITRETTGAWVGIKSGKGTGTLDTIPRASSIASISGSTIGSSVTVNITPASTDFTHKLYYTAPTQSNLVSIGTAAAGVKSLSFTPSINDCSYIPNATSGTAKITLETYSGSTKLGTVTKTFTLNVPSSVKPTISALTVAEGVSELASKFGVYVQTKSKAKVTITAAGAQGSTIKSYTTTLTNGSSVLTYNGASFTSDFLSFSGTYTVKTVVTDSRGRTAEKSTTISVVAYYPPEINDFIVQRWNTTTNAADDEGKYLHYSIKAKVAPVSNKNDKKILFEYRKAGATDWTTLAAWADITAYDYSKNYTYTTPTFSPDDAFEIRVSVKDYFTSSTPATKKADLPTARTVFDILADGTGICFGGVASQSGVCQIDMQTQFKGGQINLNAQEENDLNQFTKPNIYVSKNNASTSYENIPEGFYGTFTLEVMSAGQEGQILQRATLCSQDYPDIRERHYYLNEWGDWQKVGGIANIMTAHLSADIKTVVSTNYTKLSLVKESSIGAGLSISNGAIKIGAGIKAVKVSANVCFGSLKSDGNRHIRIKAGESYVSWASTLGYTGKNLSISLPPRIINVKTNDLIELQYYAPIADDTITAGSTANGFMTYLTVEVVA